LWRARRAGVLARDFPKRKLHLVFAAVAFTLFSVQLVLGIAVDRLAEQRLGAGADLRDRGAVRECSRASLGARRYQAQTSPRALNLRGKFAGVAKCASRSSCYLKCPAGLA
jgi:hypothetical protein